MEILRPAWADEGRAAPADRWAWNSYFGELKTHEDGHKDIAVQTARRIDELLEGARSLQPCASFRKELERPAERIAADEHRVQEEFEQSHSERFVE